MYCHLLCSKMNIIFLIVTFGHTVSSILTNWNRDAGCYLLVGQKLRHREFLVDKKVSVRSLYDCKRECDASFINCLSFSYNTDPDDRYDDNCLLSRRDVETMQLTEGSHLKFDPDYIVYGRVSQERCVANTPSVTSRLGSISLGNSCFRLAKKGVRMSSKYVRQAHKVATREECEQRCLEAGFTCRGFNFRHTTGISARYMDNCELTYQDTYGTDLDDKLAFYSHYDYDFYERIGFSNHCGTPSRNIITSGRELPFKSLSLQDHRWRFHSNLPATTGCFKLFRRNTRLDMRLVLQRHYSRDVAECQELCRKLMTCKSFAYKYTSALHRWENNNCYLSDYEIRHMDTRYDLINDPEFDMYEKDPLCTNNAIAQSRSGQLITGGTTTVSGENCYREACRPDDNGGYFFCFTDSEGSWNYCCRPDDTCHRSPEYPTEWCYVGVKERNQWRPCVTTGGLSRAFLVAAPPKNISLLDPPKKPKLPSDHQQIELKEMKDLIKN